MKPLSTRQQILKTRMDALYEAYLRDFHTTSPRLFFQNRKDPLMFPHRYSEFHDVEASAFLAATFAYGNVTSLCAFVGGLLALLKPGDRTRIAGFFFGRGAKPLGRLLKALYAWGPARR